LSGGSLVVLLVELDVLVLEEELDVDWLLDAVEELDVDWLLDIVELDVELELLTTLEEEVI
jgi:hypothetical protein